VTGVCLAVLTGGFDAVGGVRRNISTLCVGRRVTTLNWWRLPLPLKNATILLLTELCLADLSQVLDDDDDDVLDSLEDA